MSRQTNRRAAYVAAKATSRADVRQRATDDLKAFRATRRPLGKAKPITYSTSLGRPYKKAHGQIGRSLRELGCDQAVDFGLPLGPNFDREIHATKGVRCVRRQA